MEIVRMYICLEPKTFFGCAFCRYSLVGLREHIKKRPPLATTEKVQQLIRVITTFIQVLPFTYALLEVLEVLCQIINPFLFPMEQREDLVL